MAAIPVNQGPATLVTTNFGSGTFTLVTLNSSMSYFLMQNVGSLDIWVGFSGFAPANAPPQGFVLKPGSSMEFTDIIPIGDVRIFSSAATGTSISYLTA